MTTRALSSPLEETWTAHDDTEGVEIRTTVGGRTLRRAQFVWGNFGDRTNQQAAGHLAAAAPEMARVLLAIEWSAEFGGHMECCPACEAAKDAGESHRADCALDAALRKAGVDRHREEP